MEQFAKETLPVSLEAEMRHSYLDYAMSVIVGRALPDVRDGLKPVHRRVLFAMHEANIAWNRPYVKCARVVGDVMGKYHPHGDLSIYDTLVRMAQDFSLRYPLVDGQGNFGSVDGDNAAAMRYTECRLQKITAEMLADLDSETVDFAPNYDGKEQEPTVLPSRLPNLLINGSSGIAVGMATNIPPHNLTETITGCLALLGNPDLNVDELMEMIPAPDFPTAAIIYGLEGVREGYRTGRGRVVMRARTHIEDLDKGGRQAIVVDEIPYQVNKANLLIRIGELVREKKLEGISDLRDESDRTGMRVVIELKRGEVPEIILNNLYKLTQLQDSFGMNMVALVDGQPRVLNLKQFLEYFLIHRREVVTRRTVYDLRRARERGHVLEGLAVALSNVDEIIALIKASPTPPEAKAALMAQAVALDGGRGNAAARGRGCRAARWTSARIRLAEHGLQALRRAGAGDPRTAPAAADRPRAGQDHRRIPRGDGADRRLARHPRQSGARHDHHPRRADRDPRPVRRQAPVGDHRAGRRPVDRGPDRAGGNGGHAVARRLHEGAAGGRIPRAEARRPRQAGDRDEGRRFRRPDVHRQHTRFHPVLLQPRPRVLAQGLQRAAGLARRRAASRSSTWCRSSTTRRSPRSCRSRNSPRTSSCSWRPRWAR